ncbi:MAG: haloacid dehalogenase type II [Betaproteobacteria bacterium]|jgi:2-haloacid dehalogenase|nr:MAG: haloacid dehalogenase type II [Betaproteobacteria bacterium]
MTAGGIVTSFAILPAGPGFGQGILGNSQYGVKALFFDMFGTVLDWRTGVARSVEAILKPLGYSLDWLDFADAWRSLYGPGMEEVRSGRIPYINLDAVHRRMLEMVLPRLNITGLPEDVLHDLTLSWHRLDAWPDVASAFPRLRKKFLLAPVSNANIRLMVDIARRNEIRFDAILGADIARDYKPKARVYQSSAEAFNLKPRECMMVSAAAHNGDMAGAANAGLRVAAVSRPDEFGPGKSSSIPKVPVDIVAKDLNDLADKLGA